MIGVISIKKTPGEDILGRFLCVTYLFQGCDLQPIFILLILALYSSYLSSLFIASMVFSLLPKAEKRTYPSPLAPKPAPGVVTIFFSFSK